MRTTLALIIALSACCALAVGGPIREVISECPESEGVPICQIRNGWSFKYDGSSRVPLVYAPDGRFRFPLPFQLTSAEINQPFDIAPDSEGGFVVAANGSDGGTGGNPGW